MAERKAFTIKQPTGKLNVGNQANPMQNMLLSYMLGQKKLADVESVKSSTAKENRQDIGENISETVSNLPGGKMPLDTKITADIGKDMKLAGNLNQKYTLDEARAVGMADAFDAHTKYLEDSMDNMPRDKFLNTFLKATAKFGSKDIGKVGPIPTTAFDKDARVMNFAIKDMADRLLRLRSGAQINTQELERLMSLLPSFLDVSDPNDVNLEAVRTKLYTFKNELSNIKNRIMSGRQFDENNKPISYDKNAWEDVQPPVEHPVYKQYRQEKEKEDPEYMMAIDSIRKRGNTPEIKKKVAAIYKQRTGRELNV